YTYTPTCNLRRPRWLPPLPPNRRCVATARAIAFWPSSTASDNSATHAGDQPHAQGKFRIPRATDGIIWAPALSRHTESICWSGSGAPSPILDGGAVFDEKTGDGDQNSSSLPCVSSQRQLNNWLAQSAAY